MKRTAAGFGPARGASLVPARRGLEAGYDPPLGRVLTHRRTRLKISAIMNSGSGGRCHEVRISVVYQEGGVVRQQGQAGCSIQVTRCLGDGFGRVGR